MRLKNLSLQRHNLLSKQSTKSIINKRGNYRITPRQNPIKVASEIRDMHKMVLSYTQQRESYNPNTAKGQKTREKTLTNKW